MIVMVVLCLVSGLIFLFIVALLAMNYYAWEYAPPIPPPVPGTKKIACVGDSITCGALIKNRKENCYPAQLEKLLGAGYSVRNFGVNGHSLQKKASKPYWEHGHFQASSDFGAALVILMLGTNDARENNWKGIEAYAADYREMLGHYTSLPGRPIVYAMTPPPQFAKKGREKKTRLRNERIGEMIESIKTIAAELGVKVIDIHAALGGHPEYFGFDGVHPNAEGARAIAETVYSKLSA
jgi:acyl-CoA thioesterase-1